MNELNMEKGTVIRRTKGFYFLRTESGEEVECKIKGNLFQNSRMENQVAVGDHVNFRKPEDNQHGLIMSIQPRKSFLSRTRIGRDNQQIIAANIDYLFIVASAKTPPFRRNLIFRMLVAAHSGSVTPVLILTKTDLVSAKKVEKLIHPFKNLDI